MANTRIEGCKMGSKSGAFMATCLLVLLICVDASTINIKNQCSKPITACSASQTASTACYVLGAGSGSQLIDVGSSWPGGIVWGFPGSSGNPGDGNNAKPQANLAEFTINGFSSQDSYDISVVNAYNLPMQIDAIGHTGSGTNCGTIQCSIPNLNSFCQSPNTLTGPPGDGCYNHDGPNVSSGTSGTRAFKNMCPKTITFTTDTVGTVYGCSTGTNYEVVFCY
ncbi:hypothetical protein O6H91_03G018600 [Diphasiastrum complanatum]|uniref:Uncharacterized protein n=2 Tax=Diphasiastrum complanatum TaxID=34168 RepID=A0ACC2E3Q8_DIPCM|nr:hypothetical protein O6H91_03G016200 [Diphasiastrum complanatum]KAJ7561207.1 hypothetical protein O6H91_03G018600 [Diphasiastrum complanatum]